MSTTAQFKANGTPAVESLDCAGYEIRFDAASETEFLPQLSPATPNWGSGVITLPPLRRRNYGF